MQLAPERVTSWASLVLTLAAAQHAGSCTIGSDSTGIARPSTHAKWLGEPASTRANGGELVARWNDLAYEIAFAEDSFRTFKGHRAFAMMHLAMHDAVNAAVPGYVQHTFIGRDPLAHASTAAGRAAHDVLLALYPGAAARLEMELSRTPAAVPDDDARTRGMALGRQAAASHLAARVDDGWDVTGRHEFRKAIGAYRTTPPWNGFVLQPGFRHAKPFGLTTAAQFRPAAPPALASPAYANAFDEVRRFGRAESRDRTNDQTAYAIWWMEFVEGSVNRLARHLVVERRLSLPEAARLFALLNMSLYDTYVAVWDSKYEFDHWRPYSAIREAANDGNPGTEPESSWQPLRPTPPFPEYVSAHAAACASTFGVLRRELGDIGPFELTTTTAPQGMPTRRFARFEDAAAECADSRVRLGWHFRYATSAGAQLGMDVARYIAEHHLHARRDGAGSTLPPAIGEKRHETAAPSVTGGPAGPTPYESASRKRLGLRWVWGAVSKRFEVGGSANAGVSLEIRSRRKSRVSDAVARCVRGVLNVTQRQEPRLRFVRAVDVTSGCQTPSFPRRALVSRGACCAVRPRGRVSRLSDQHRGQLAHRDHAV